MSETNTLLQPETLNPSQQQLDLLDQLLKPEVQASLNTLVEQLPQLTELVNILTKSYDFAKSVSTDNVLKNDIVGAVSEMAGPIVDSAKHVAANAIEAKDRAEASHEVIGLFGMLKMLKEPQVQKMFRFVNAYLQVSNERSNQK